MWRVFLRYLAFRKFGSIVIENLLIMCCVLDAVYIRLHVWTAEPNHVPIGLRAFFIAITFQIALHFRDVYDLHRTLSFTQLFSRLAQAVTLASVVLTLLYYFLPDLMVGRGVFVIAIALISIFLLAWHTLLRVWVGVRSPKSNLLIMGTGRLARELVSEILHHPELGLGVAGFVDDNPKLIGVSIVNPKVLGLCQELPRVVTEHKIDRIVVELQDRRGRLPIEQLLTLKTQGVAIEDATTLYERITGKIAIENLKPSWMIFNSGFEVSKSTLLQKRILSLAVSSALLLVFSPVILLIMLLIKLDSRGPIFHKQERVGQDGQTFTVWKFRSMREDAEKGTGPVWASSHDPRVTRVGRIIRRLRLDELPQLINVFRGDMSLVGPRPERPHFVNELSAMIPFYHLRHAIKPGVTGWAQINYGYGNSVHDAVEKLQYDLFYIKHVSTLLDILIVFETIKTVLFRRGS